MKTAEHLAKKGDRFKAISDGKTFSVDTWVHRSFGNYDVFHLIADDGEERKVASFALFHHYKVA